MATELTAKRILLIEDDRYLRRACEAGLRQHGFTVVSAADGEEGLRLARSETPDLILLDLLMPKMSGVDVLRALRADVATQDVPVLIISNSSREQYVHEVIRLGVVGYWVKAKFSLRELATKVNELLVKLSASAPKDDREVRA